MNNRNTFLDPNFSIEDISYGLHKEKKVNISKEIVFDLGIEEFAQIVTDRNNDDCTYYAIEATQNYSDAVLCGNFANLALESLSDEVKFLSNIKTSFSVERLDPYAFSLEEDDKEAKKKSRAKKANIFKRIFSAIALAFKKLIMMIGNFIRSVLNAIKGGMLKSAAKFYEEHKDDLKGLLQKYGDLTFKGVLPSGKPDYDHIKLEHIQILSDEFDKYQEAGVKLVEKIENTKVPQKGGVPGCLSGIRRAFGKLGDYMLGGDDTPRGWFHTAENRLVSALALGSTKAMEYLRKKNVMTSIGAPAKVASVIIFGKDKTTVTSIKFKDFEKAFPFENLSEESMDKMKTIIKEGEKGAKMLQKSYTQIQKTAQAVSDAISSSADPELYKYLDKAARKLTSLGNATRMLNVYMCGVLLNVHKEHLRCVSYLAQIARALVKKGGSGDSKGGKPKKKFDTKTGKPLE